MFSIKTNAFNYTETGVVQSVQYFVSYVDSQMNFSRMDGNPLLTTLTELTEFYASM